MSQFSRRATQLFIGLILTLTLTSIPAQADPISDTIELQGRSIPDVCHFIYRIETDFEVRIPATVDAFSKVTLVYYFQDIYIPGQGKSEEREVSLQYQPNTEQWQASLTEVTLSQNPKFLYQSLELYFRFESAQGSFTTRHFHAPLTHLMDRCYPGGRPATPFQPLRLLLKSS